MLSLDGGEHATPHPYRSRWIIAEPAEGAALRAAYFALRSRVFVAEQGLFPVHDRDEHDAHAIPIVASATSAGMPDEVVGVVRIYAATAEFDGGVWYGGRLAVERPYRRVAEVGAALIRAAVGAARGYGARRFFATVQADNQAYFERHHFRALSALRVCGHPHVLMEADLAAFSVPRWAARAEAA